jgi:hypothetical protein
MPEKPASENVAVHQGPRSKSRGKPTAQVGEKQATRVEERPLEWYTRIPASRRPVAVEDEQTREFLVHQPLWSPRGNGSLRL